MHLDCQICVSHISFPIYSLPILSIVSVDEKKGLVLVKSIYGFLFYS